MCHDHTSVGRSKFLSSTFFNNNPEGGHRTTHHQPKNNNQPGCTTYPALKQEQPAPVIISTAIGAVAIMPPAPPSQSPSPPLHSLSVTRPSDGSADGYAVQATVGAHAGSGAPVRAGPSSNSLVSPQSDGPSGRHGPRRRWRARLSRAR